MTRVTVPTPGTNKLTERLLKQGVKLDDVSTWPEDVWLGEESNFCYSREWRFTPTWESPCGLLIHDHGDMWGETWVDGEFKCAENDNPLFGCPTPAKPCPFRKPRMPAGINCQFHRTDREWNEADSVERLEKEREGAKRRLWEEDLERYPEWNGRCINLESEDQPDGSVRRTMRYRLYNCIDIRCESQQCVCRCGAKRDIRPVNIFYDLYIERRFNDGLVPYSERKLRKVLKVFEKPIARTAAEIALKIWRHDPDSPMLPVRMRNKLNAGEQAQTGELRREGYFIRHHRYWDGHTDVELVVEIRNIHIGRNEQRDMMRDLQDVRDGIEVTHDSDLQKAAKAQVSERRRTAKVRKLATVYANQTERGESHGAMNMILAEQKPDFRDAVHEEAERILAKREAKARKEEARAAQISMFDLGGDKPWSR